MRERGVYSITFALLLLGSAIAWAQQYYQLPSATPWSGAPQQQYRQPRWWQTIQPTAGCIGDSACATQGTGFICVAGQCVLQCDDSDADVTKLPLVDSDPQLKIPGKVNYYIQDMVKTGTTYQKTWVAKEAKDVCKTKAAAGGMSAIIEQICKASGSGGTALAPDMKTIPCPLGTTCQWGIDPKTGVNAAWCGPIMIGEPTCDATKEACCVNGKKTGTDICASTPGCQKLASECPADLCPDIAGIQIEYPEKNPDGTGACHAIDDKACTDPDPEKTYPFAHVHCVKGEKDKEGDLCAETHLDYCADATHVWHLVCTPDGTTVTNLTECPGKATCINGQCVGKTTPEPLCTDQGNDPAKKEWVIGESLATGAAFAKGDECQDKTTVIQYQCEPADPKGYTGVPTPCGNGEECADGACKPKEPGDGGGGTGTKTKCEESDDPAKKDNVHIKDKVIITFENGATKTQDDYCNGTHVVETNCENIDPAKGYGEIEKVCPDGEICAEELGICAPVTCPLCEDTDGGKNTSVAGTVSGVSNAFGIATPFSAADECTADGKGVVEQFCTTPVYPCHDEAMILCTGDTACFGGGCKVGCVSDDDPGNDPLKLGTVIWSDGTSHPDYCSEAKKLKQLDCNTATGEETEVETTCDFGCKNGVCKPGPCEGKAIDDGNVCTTDTCDPATGTISNTPIPIDDGNACTEDGCNSVTGVYHKPIAVDDGNACTTDACVPDTGPVYSAQDCPPEQTCNPKTGICECPPGEEWTLANNCAPPQPVSPQITAGDWHTCHLKPEVMVTCWGRNTDGQLGNGTKVNASTPVAVFDPYGGALADVIDVDGGMAHTCAAIGDGTGRCWGKNNSGQLGTGKVGGATKPALVKDLANAIGLAAGGEHTCAVANDGTAKCWGKNTYGQLGIGTTGGTKTTPQTVQGLSNATAITTGYYHSCALKDDTSIVCWGIGGHGELGVAPDDPLLQNQKTSIPVQVQDGSGGIAKDMKAIAAGTEFTCAITTQGNVRCWGKNWNGKLGQGYSGGADPYPKPVVMEGGIPIANIATLATGHDHACAGEKNGPVWCWGDNWAGQLGSEILDAESPQAVKVTVPNVVHVKDLATGFAHSCALLEDNSVKCWGNNFYGQLGTPPSLPSPTCDPNGKAACPLEMPPCDPYGGFSCVTIQPVCDPYGSLSCTNAQPTCPAWATPTCTAK